MMRLLPTALLMLQVISSSRLKSLLLSCSLMLLAACGPSTGSIGAMLSKNHVDGRVVVRHVPRDMEAARAGLEPDDEVLLVDGQDARKMTAEQIHQALIGPIGSSVSVTVRRGGEILRLSIKRGALK